MYVVRVQTSNFGLYIPFFKEKSIEASHGNFLLVNPKIFVVNNGSLVRKWQKSFSHSLIVAKLSMLTPPKKSKA